MWKPSKRSFYARLRFQPSNTAWLSGHCSGSLRALCLCTHSSSLILGPGSSGKERTESMSWLSEFLRIQDKSLSSLSISRTDPVSGTPPWTSRGIFIIKVKIWEEFVLRNKFLRRKSLFFCFIRVISSPEWPGHITEKMDSHEHWKKLIKSVPHLSQPISDMLESPILSYFSVHRPFLKYI